MKRCFNRNVAIILSAALLAGTLPTPGSASVIHFQAQSFTTQALQPRGIFEGFSIPFFAVFDNLRSRLFHFVSRPASLKEQRVTSGLKRGRFADVEHWARQLTEPEKTIIEGSLDEVAHSLLSRHAGERKATNLRDAYEVALKRYPSLSNSPIKLRITEGGEGSVARIEGHTIVLSEGLLPNFPLLRQELASEEFGHLVYRLLLETLRPKNPHPTAEEHLSEELHTDLKKLEDFLRIVDLRDRALLLRGMINGFDREGFYEIYFKLMTPAERDTVLRVLEEERGVVGEYGLSYSEASRLRNLPYIHADLDRQTHHFLAEQQVIIELLSFYHRHNTYPELIPYFRAHGMEIHMIEENLSTYRKQFNELRTRFHEMHDVPLLRRYFNLSGIEVSLGKFEDRLSEVTHQISSSGLTLRRGDKKLSIHSVTTPDGLFLIIGNKNYRVLPGLQVDLYALVHQEDPLAILGNADLLDFFDIDAANYFSATQHLETFTMNQSGVQVDLYDQLKDPRSRMVEPELMAEPISLDRLQEARQFLRNNPFIARPGPNEVVAVPENIVLARLHFMAILAQSNASVDGITAPQALEDRILYTERLRELATHYADNAAINRLVIELLWSAPLLAVRTHPETPRMAEISLNELENHHIAKQIPFEIRDADNPQKEFDRLVAIYDEVVRRGDLEPYFIINIQNFTSQTYLAYLEFLESISRHYNGHATFLLSVQPPGVMIEGEKEPYKPLDHDMPGTYTARKRVVDLLGEEFYLHHHMANISDGGEKTRAANLGVRYEQFSRALTAEGRSFLEQNMLTAGAMWLSLPQFGQEMRLWLASDGFIKFGQINIAGRPLSQLPDDFEIGACGPPALVITPAQMVVLRRLVDRHGWNEKFEDSDELFRDPEFQRIWPDITQAIARRDLTQRGIFVTDASEGMTNFIEKGRTWAITRNAYFNGTKTGGYVTENIFLLLERADVSLKLLKTFNRARISDDDLVYQKLAEKRTPSTLTGIARFSAVEATAKRLREADRFLGHRPRSVFETIFQGFFKNDPLVRYNAQTGNGILKKIYGISYGEKAVTGDIADLKQHVLMWQQYVRSNTGPKEIHVVSNPKIKITYRGDRSEALPYLLRNVEFIGEGEVEIGDSVALVNSRIIVEGYLSIPDRTIILDSSLMGPLQFAGQGGVVAGVDYVPGEVMEANRILPQVLRIYGNETIVQIDYQDGKSILSRMINSMPFKEDAERKNTIGELISGKYIWGAITGFLGLPQNLKYETVYNVSLQVLIPSEKWFLLVHRIFSESLSNDTVDETTIKVIKTLRSGLSRREAIDEMARIFEQIPTVSLTLSNHSQVLSDATKLYNDYHNADPQQWPLIEQSMGNTVRELYRNRFGAQFETLLNQPGVRYGDMRDVSYSEALYRVFLAMHPLLLGQAGISLWRDVENKTLIQLGVYADSKRIGYAKENAGSLYMQSRTTRRRYAIDRERLEAEAA